MKKIVFVLAVIVSMGAGAANAVGIHDRGISLCSNAGLNIPGNCHFFELYANWTTPLIGGTPTLVNPPVGSIMESMGYVSNVHITYSGPTQVNVALTPNTTASFDCYKYIAIPNPLNGGSTLWAGEGFDDFVLKY